MDERDILAAQFEANRSHLRAVAYRMLGSQSEAEDAVQETWLRLSRTDDTGIENLGGWLTTVVARVCLDMLRSRKSRREEPWDTELPEPAVEEQGGANPEREMVLADTIGIALLVVLEKLEPAERIAFVLHEMFDLPFEEIARVVERSPTATRQLASRARRRVRGATVAADADIRRQQQVVDAFLAASRAGDLNAIIAVLDPDVVFRADRTAVQMGGAPELRGAAAVANSFKGRAQAARPALMDGGVGVAVVLGGQLRIALRITFANNRIAEIEAVADPERLRTLDPTVIDG
jgi:RNA polymerase sigma-70 factor (ECF subfamily)